MTTKDEALRVKRALKLALEALRKSRDRIVEQGGSGWKLHAQQCVNAITAIREALAEQPAQQEPVALRWRYPGYRWTYEDYKPNQFFGGRVDKQLLYPSPQLSKPWVGLTDEEIIDMADPLDWSRDCAEQFARAIEAKLREKNT